MHTVYNTAMKAILSIGLLALSVCFAANTAKAQNTQFSFENCKQHFPLGINHANNSSQLEICRQGFATLYNTRKKIPEFTSYVLTKQETLGCLKRGEFYDPKYLEKSNRASVSEFINSGFDKGHMANDADMSWNETVHRESYDITNAAPQLPNFNRGIWKALELRVRSWAWERGSILVISGPVYTGQDFYLNSILVPNAFYKIVIDLQNLNTIAFLIPHLDELKTNSLSNYLVSIDKIEQFTGRLIINVDKSRKSSVVWPAPIGQFQDNLRIACR